MAPAEEPPPPPGGRISGRFPLPPLFVSSGFDSSPSSLSGSGDVERSLFELDMVVGWRVSSSVVVEGGDELK